MAQAKITINGAQAKALGLLVHNKKPVYNILYDPRSGINLRETAPGQTITVPDGADLLNLKRFQATGYFDVAEGTIMDHLAAFSAVTIDGTTLTLTFSGAVTAPVLTSTEDGAATDDIIFKVNGTAVAATFAAVTASPVITATVASTVEDISVQITQTGASKIKDANRSAVLPATKTFSVVPILESVEMNGTMLSLNFSEPVYAEELSSTVPAGEEDDIIVLVDGEPVAVTIGAVTTENPNQTITVDLGENAPGVDVSVTLTAVGAAKIQDADETAVITDEVAKTYTLGTESDFLTFALAEQKSEAVIDSELHTIELETVNNTDLSALVPSFTLSEKASASIGGVAQIGGTSEVDFSLPVTYIVTAENGDATEWSVLVTAALSDAKEITAFGLIGYPDIESTIDEAAGTIAITVPFGTDVSDLVATFTLSPEAIVLVGTTEQSTGVTLNDFSLSVTYRVVAEDSSTKDYIVTISIEAPNTETDFTLFEVTPMNGTASIDTVNHTIAVSIPAGNQKAALVATFTLSDGATAAIGENGQISGETTVDFTDPVTYAVTAEDGITTQNWIVTITVEAA